MPRALPQNWREVRLEKVCQKITVGHVGPMVDQYEPHGIPFLRSQNIMPFRIDLNDVKFINAGFHAKLKKSALLPGDVVVVRTGYPGTAAVIPSSLHVANCADLVIIRPSHDIDAWFLACVFNSVWGKGVVAGNLVGVAQQHFNVGAAKNLNIFLPPIKTQRRIASILSAYDDLIENNTRRIAILEEMARRLYEEWFVNFRFPGHETARFVETELGFVPEGWEVGALGSIVSINPESIKLSSAPKAIEYINISSVSTGNISQVQPMTFVDAPSRARRKVKSTDILWSCVRPNLKAYALIINPAPNTVASTGFAVIRAQNAPYSYIYNLVTSDLFVSYLVNHATGAAYPAVKQSDFEAAKILLPRKQLLHDFHEKVEPMLLLCAELMQKNANLRAQRDLLLPRLISGELDVSKAEDLIEGAAK